MNDVRRLRNEKRASADAADIHNVDWSELPLSCPTPAMSLWDSHPRVYLPLHETKQASCMYCGRTYVLRDAVPGEREPAFVDEDIERQYHKQVDRLRREQALAAADATPSEHE